MSCIDSAIIRALVEHIGMNPDDVPTTGGSSGVCTGEEHVVPFESHSGLFKVKTDDMIQLFAGDVVRVTTSKSQIYDYVVVERRMEPDFNYTLCHNGYLYDFHGDDSGYHVISGLGDNTVQPAGTVTSVSLITFTSEQTKIQPLSAFHVLGVVRSLPAIIQYYHNKLQSETETGA